MTGKSNMVVGEHQGPAKRQPCTPFMQVWAAGAATSRIARAGGRLLFNQAALSGFLKATSNITLRKS